MRGVFGEQQPLVILRHIQGGDGHSCRVRTELAKIKAQKVAENIPNSCLIWGGDRTTRSNLSCHNFGQPCIFEAHIETYSRSPANSKARVRVI